MWRKQESMFLNYDENHGTLFYAVIFVVIFPSYFTSYAKEIINTKANELAFTL